MKKFLAIILVAAGSSVLAQGAGKNKDPHMAATLTDGYYVTLKGDTVKGKIRNNYDDQLDIYKTIMFAPKEGAKLVAISPKKAKSYGFDGRHFTLIPFDAGEVYIERLAKGRINFFEYKYRETINAEVVISSTYFVQDTKADENEKDLRELKQISTKFYKKALKPYMKEQPTTWTDLDKFTFNKDAVVNAIKEFNKYYE